MRARHVATNGCAYAGKVARIGACEAGEGDWAKYFDHVPMRKRCGEIKSRSLGSRRSFAIFSLPWPITGAGWSSSIELALSRPRLRPRTLPNHYRDKS